MGGGGLALVFVGMIVAVVAIILRAFFFRKSRHFEFGWHYYLCISMSMFGTVLAALGYFLLITESPVGTAPPTNTTSDYSPILSVLSILAAGITAGFFAFSYNDMGNEEIILPTLLSICFVILFYVVFGALSLYMGRSRQVHFAEYVSVFGPLIMWMLLAANVAYDYLDYRGNK